MISKLIVLSIISRCIIKNMLLTYNVYKNAWQYNLSFLNANYIEYKSALISFIIKLDLRIKPLPI